MSGLFPYESTNIFDSLVSIFVLIITQMTVWNLSVTVSLIIHVASSV